MKHLGDICTINGAEIEPVDVVTGGSPCQDLSVAGKRAGLQGERSGLFMEQIRVIKEMRNADKQSGRANEHIRPRYMVWENVPGAFSSNAGEDFRIVLEETAKVAEADVSIPRPPGKWANAGCIMGDGWSIAWRVLDAQFWGVPQRRRRIALVADFGGQSAPEILFEREGLSGHSAESGAEGEGVAADAERGVGTTSGSLTPFLPQTARIYDADGKWPTLQANSNGGQNRQAVFYPDVARSLTARHDSSPCIDRGQNIVAFTQNQRDEVRDLGDKAGALAAEPGMKQQTYVAGFCQGASPAAQTIGYQEEVSPTIKGAPSGTAQVPAVFDARGNGDGSIATYSFQRTDELKESQVASTQSARQYKSPTDLVAAVDCRNGTENPDINGTLQAKPNGGTSCNLQNTVRTNQSVRRLTPLECERLQGYEDGWTDIPPQTDVTEEDLIFWRPIWSEWQTMNGKKPKTDKQIIKWLQSEPADSARYKALGNSIALPPWRFVLSRIHKQGARTMASLFDGIGGFPKVWNEMGGQTLWASEVEPFPIAVTKYHFPNMDKE